MDSVQARILIDAAKPLLRRKMTLARDDFSAATVAAAIQTPAGNIYTGICFDVSCGIGFCAELAAAAEMLKGGETQIEMVVAVSDEGVLAPCGRCREMMMQLDVRNTEATVVLEGESVKLRDLVPHHWMLTDPRKKKPAP